MKFYFTAVIYITLVFKFATIHSLGIESDMNDTVVNTSTLFTTDGKLYRTSETTQNPKKLNDAHSEVSTKNINCTIKNQPNAIVAVYIMTSFIIVLCVVIIVLFTIIFKLKSKIKNHCDDKIEVITTNTMSKYIRQISERSEVTYTGENSYDENRRKYNDSRNELSVYDKNNDFEKPIACTNITNIADFVGTNMSKVGHQHSPMTMEQMKAIVVAVNEKKLKRNECISLSNLEKIISESKIKDNKDYSKAEHSASSRILDIVDTGDTSPSFLTVKEVISNFESSTLLTSTKTIDAANNKLQSRDKMAANFPYSNSITDNIPSILLHNPTDNGGNLVDITSPDDNKILSISSIQFANKNTAESDDIYFDMPNNNPVDFLKITGENEDEVYDNPPSNRPVTASNEFLDNIYDLPTDNKLLQNNSEAKNEIYYELDSTKFDVCLFPNNGSSSQEKVDDNEAKLDDKTLHSNSRGITVNSDEDSGYSLRLTSSKESCFDSSYVNARSLNP